MSHYNHLTIFERETIFLSINQGLSIRNIAKRFHRSPSTISREIQKNRNYSPTKVQKNYFKNKSKCGRHKLLSNKELWQMIRHLFVDFQWSPEQIEYRLKRENYKFHISYNTIYRAIYQGLFETEKLSKGNRGLVRKLRHKGKSRHTQGYKENRGKIRIINSIHVRPIEVNERTEFGHWEADTVAGKAGGSCLLTLTDRKSRFLISERISKKSSISVKDKMIELLNQLDESLVKTITPDRGKEFSKHQEISENLNGVPFYFPDAHAPWQRGTNENTNGLIREYFPKTKEMDSLSNE